MSLVVARYHEITLKRGNRARFAAQLVANMRRATADLAIGRIGDLHGRLVASLPDESLWTKERGAIEQEVAQDLSNPEYVFYEQLLAAVFKDTPYEHSPLGTRPSAIAVPSCKRSSTCVSMNAFHFCSSASLTALSTTS